MIASSETAEASEASEAGTSEEVAQYVIEVAESGSVEVESASSVFYTAETELVVSCLLVRVAEDCVCLGCFLEVLFGRFLFLIRAVYPAVRMPFERGLSVRALDIIC